MTPEEGSPSTGSRPTVEPEDPLDDQPGAVITLLDTLPEPVAVVGPDRRILYANQALESVFEYETGELGERPVEDLVRPEDRRGCLHAFGEMLNAHNGGPAETELDGLIAVTGDGERFPVTMTLRPLSMAGEDLVLATVHDRRPEVEARTQMAQLERARGKIHYQKTLLESQNEASIDGILIVDEESRIVSYNQRFLDLWGVEDALIEVGRTDEEALGSVLDDIEDVDAFLEKVEYLHENPMETIRDEVHLKDGTVLERWSTPVVSDDGAYYGRGWYFRDITDRKRVEEELRRHREELEELVQERTEELEATAERLREEVEQRKRAEEELEQRVWELARSNADLERFAYVASHDLQEPLRMIASFVQLLERDYGDALDEDAEVYIDYAVEGATRLQNLIRDLLEYSRVGSEGGAREPVKMDHVVARAREKLDDMIERTGAEVEVPQPLPTVLGNPSQLVQAVEALVSNAIKFRDPDAPPRIRITAGEQEAGAGWHFRVEDNGIGVEPAYHDRIFVLFQRLHARADYEGTGIGLALCRKIVENHGGRIWIESEGAGVSKPDTDAAGADGGGGSTFHFTLPGPEATEMLPQTGSDAIDQAP